MTAPARVVVLDRIADALERIATAMERAHAPKARPLRRDGSPAVVPTDEERGIVHWIVPLGDTEAQVRAGFVRTAEASPLWKALGLHGARRSDHPAVVSAARAARP